MKKILVIAAAAGLLVAQGVYAAGAVTWVNCGQEGTMCDVGGGGTKTVRYGGVDTAGGQHWAYLDIKGTGSCSWALFKSSTQTEGEPSAFGLAGGGICQVAK